jgi:hypothetical protein
MFKIREGLRTVEIDVISVWRFFLTLIFQWAIIVLERAMLIGIWGLEDAE